MKWFQGSCYQQASKNISTLGYSKEKDVSYQISLACAWTSPSTPSTPSAPPMLKKATGAKQGICDQAVGFFSSKALLWNGKDWKKSSHLYAASFLSHAVTPEHYESSDFNTAREDSALS